MYNVYALYIIKCSRWFTISIFPFLCPVIQFQKRKQLYAGCNIITQTPYGVFLPAFQIEYILFIRIDGFNMTKAESVN